MLGEFLSICSLMFFDFISSFLNLSVVSAIDVSGSTLFVFNWFNFSINSNIEFKSSVNFLAFSSVTEILDNFRIRTSVVGFEINLSGLIFD